MSLFNVDRVIDSQSGKHVYIENKDNALSIDGSSNLKNKLTGNEPEDSSALCTLLSNQNSCTITQSLDSSCLNFECFELTSFPTKADLYHHMLDNAASQQPSIWSPLR